MKNKHLKKLLSMILCASLTFSMISVPVTAAPQQDTAGTASAESPLEVQEKSNEDDPAGSLPEGSYVEGEALVVIKGDIPFGEEAAGSINTTISDFGFSLAESWPIEGGRVNPGGEEAAGGSMAAEDDVTIALVKGNGMSTQEMIEKLEELDSVELAGPNVRYEIESVSSDRLSENEAEAETEIIEAEKNETPISEIEADGKLSENEALQTGKTEEAAGDAADNLIYSLYEETDTTDYSYNDSYISGEMVTDPLSYYQTYYSVSGINLNKAIASENSTMSDNIVAVIDTGVDYTNPDLIDNMWSDTKEIFGRGTSIHGKNCVTGEYDPMPKNGSHGTHVAGAIAARTGNGIGVAGTAGTGHTKIMGLRVVDDNDNGFSTTQVMDAYSFILKAKAYGYNVVAANNSWGSTSGRTVYDSILNYIITRAGKMGVLTFFSAGNDNKDLAYDYALKDTENPYVVIVASSDINNVKSDFSSYSEYYADVASPGSNILSTVLNSGTDCYRLLTTMSSNGANTFYSIVSANDWKEKTSENSIIGTVGGEDIVFESKEALNEKGITLSQGTRGELQFTFDLKKFAPDSGLTLKYRIKNPFKEVSGIDPTEYAYTTDMSYVFKGGEGDGCFLALTKSSISSDIADLSITDNDPAGEYSASDDTSKNVLFTADAAKPEYFYITQKITVESSTIYMDNGVDKNLKPTLRLNGFSIGKACNPYEDSSSDYFPYEFESGTSMASPMAAGMAAEVAALYTIKDPLELRGRVVGGTRKLSDSEYVHTDNTAQDRVIRYKYYDMVASGGTLTYDALLHNNESDYNANIWSVDALSGNIISVNGYALKGAGLELDGVAISSNAEDYSDSDRHISFKSGSNLFDGKRHRFIVTDAESGRSYKAELTIPMVYDNTPFVPEYVSDLPGEFRETTDDSVTESGKDFYYGDGMGKYFYAVSTVSSGEWRELNAPGCPFSDSSNYEGKTYLKYFYSDGYIYAICSIADNGKINLLTNCYDIANDSWSGYQSLLSGDLLSHSISGAGNLNAVSYEGRLYISSTIALTGNTSSMLAYTDNGKNTFTVIPTNENIISMINYDGSLYGLDSQDGHVDIREYDTYENKFSRDIFFTITDPKYLEALSGIMTQAGDGLIAGGIIDETGTNMIYLDPKNKGCIDLGYVGTATGLGYVVNTMAVYGSSPESPYSAELYFLATSGNRGDDNAIVEGIYKLPAAVFERVGLKQYRLSNSVYVVPDISIRTGSETAPLVSLTLSNNTPSGNSQTVSSKVTTQFNNNCIVAHRGDKVTASSEAAVSSDRLNFTGFDLPSGSDLISDTDSSRIYKFNPFSFYINSTELSGSGYVEYLRALYSETESDDDDENTDIDGSISRYTIKFVDTSDNDRELQSYLLKKGETIPADWVKASEEALKGYDDQFLNGWSDGSELWDFSLPVYKNLTLKSSFLTLSGNTASLDPDGYPESTDEYVFLVKGQSYVFGDDNNGEWVTTDSRYLSINRKNGKVKAKKATTGDGGNKYITISNNAAETDESKKIIIYEPVISDKKLSIIIGDDYDLTLKDVNGGSLESNMKVTWTSTKPTVASVCNGTVYARAKGTATIKAWVNGKSYSSKISVKDSYNYSSADLNEERDISIYMTPFTSIKLKKSKQLNFDPKNVEKWYCNDDEITDDTGLISVKNGRITANRVGIAKLYGVDKTSRVSRRITITIKALATEKVAYMNLGQKKTLKFNKVNNKKATWWTSGTDPEAVSVNNNGKLTANKTGSTKVTCSYNGVRFYTTVYTEDPKLLSSNTAVYGDHITLNQPKANKPVYELTIDNNYNYQLKTADISQKIYFKSNKPKVAFVDENGIIYAKKSGKAIISAKVNNKTIKVKVTVK